MLGPCVARNDVKPDALGTVDIESQIECLRERLAPDAAAAPGQRDASELHNAIRTREAGQEDESDGRTVLDDHEVSLVGGMNRLRMALARPLRDPWRDLRVMLDCQDQSEI